MGVGSVSHLLRWHTKKIARCGVAGISSIVDTGSSAIENQVVRVLTYHRFGATQKDPFCVSPEQFERHLQLLSSQGRAVSLDQLCEFVTNGTTIPADACLVTIDDGMISTLEFAYPLLEKYQIPAVAFVSSKLIGFVADDLEERYMTWTELQELKDSGLVSIGSHAHTHRSLGKLSLPEAQHEAEVSRTELGQKLGCEIRSFAYPFGTAQDFNDQTDAMLARVGYSIAFNSMHGPVRAGMNPLSLPRVKVEGGESLRMFDRISRGALDRWRLVDERLSRLQLVRREIA